jgi:CRP/FNR family transcriptional regulator
MKPISDILARLREIDIFSGIDNTALKMFSDSCGLNRVEPKEILFNEGIKGDRFFLLIEGALRIYKTSSDGSETTIKIVHEGEFLAEVILFDSPVYPVTAVALTGSTVLSIRRDAFFSLLKNEDARNRFITALFTKMRFLSEKIHYLNSYDVEERFFRFLADQYGRHERYELSIQKKDIASAIGTIPETFSRLILRLTRMKIIAWKENILYVKEGFWDEAGI